MKNQPRVWQVRELFDQIGKGAFGDLDPLKLAVRFPQYVPPVLLSQGTELILAKAMDCLRQCGSEESHYLASAHYEDNCAPHECSVVMSVTVQTKSSEHEFTVEKAWAHGAKAVTGELLSRNIALTIAAHRGDLSFYLHLPVYGKGWKRTFHRDTILLVEDDSFVRGATREVLEIAGYRVLETESAELALDVFEKFRKTICVAVSDVTLPGKDGRELARLVHASLPTVPVLLTSGYCAPVQEDRARRTFYLAKPYHPAALLAAVHRCLEVLHPVPQPRSAPALGISY